MLARGGEGSHEFLINSPAEMLNWIEALASVVGHRGRPLRQKAAQGGQSAVAE